MDENSFPPLPPSALDTLFEMPEFTTLPFDRRREKLGHALSAVYDYSAAQPDFTDADSKEFGGLAQRAYNRLDKEHTFGEKAGGVLKAGGAMLGHLAGDIGVTGIAAVSAASQLQLAGADPTHGAAQAWGYGFGVGSANLINSLSNTLNRWTSSEDNTLKDALGKVRKQIDDGSAPITDPVKYMAWLRGESAKLVKPQVDWTAKELNEYGITDKVEALRVAEANSLAPVHGEGANLNSGLLQAYVRTRDPKMWEQLEKSIAASPMAEALGKEAKVVTSGEAGQAIDSVFGEGASNHLLSSSDPLAVATYLLPAGRIGKLIGGGKVTNLAAGAGEMGALGAVATIEHDPDASAGEIAKGAGEMAAFGTALHLGGWTVGAAWKKYRGAPERGLDEVHELANEMANDPATAAVVDEIAGKAKEPPVPLEEPTPAAPTDQRASATGTAENHQPPGLTEPQVNSIPENATPEPTTLRTPAAEPAADGVPIQATPEQPVERGAARIPDSRPDVQPTRGNVAPEPVESFGSGWVKATEENAPTPKDASRVEPGTDTFHAGVPLPKFEIRKVSPLDEATGERSSTLQRSTQETAKAQKDLRKAVPSPARRAAISVWREAAGDPAILAAWEKAAKSAWMKEAAKIAQTLTPKEIAVAQTVAHTFDTMEKRGNAYDVLKNHRDNYIPHVWALENPGKGFGTRSLKKKFAFAKARTFNTFFDGDQAGMKPRTLDIADLVPGYIAEMNRVIADRQFVADILTKNSKEGTPLAIPKGNVTTTEGVDVAHLVHPQGQNFVKDVKGNPVDQSAYEVMQGQPALRTWRWRGKDTEGNPIMVNGDLNLHPEAYQRIHAMLGESGIRKWYRDTEGSLQVPKAFARALDVTQSAIKREMFGLLPPFHQVQEGTHAIGHLVNPFFGLKDFDLASPAGKDAARYTMLLSDRSSGRQYFEGVGAHKTLITAAARKLGGKAGAAVADVVEGYQKYIFGSYIPRLKYATYQKILTRNTGRFKDDLAKGKVKLEDVKLLSGQQTDAAYGHLNYAVLDRNPTFQHFLQLGLLAPDFLEARARFVGQAAKSITSKVGHEQLKAIAVLAAAQAGISFTLAQLTGGEWKAKHPFEFTRNGRRYTMRSVPEDLMRALAFIGGDVDTSRQFVSGRINPLLQTGIQLETGMNWRGEKVTALDTMEELLAKFIPLTARSLHGIRDLTETGRNSPTSPLEQFAGSVGLKISRASPITEVHKLAGDWMEKQKIQTKSVSYPTSKYQQLRYALEDSDPERAKAAYDELAKTMSRAKIVAGFHESINHPFTQSQDMDRKFRASLPEPERAIFDLAKQKRQDILSRFRLIKK